MGFNIRTHNLPKDFYQNGLSFMESSWRCFGKEENGEYRIIDKGKLCQLTVPAVVNAAFACEMFLKALLMKYGISYSKEHSLVKLFDLLPSNVKKEINHFCGDLNDETKFRTDLCNHATLVLEKLIKYVIENPSSVESIAVQSY